MLVRKKIPKMYKEKRTKKLFINPIQNKNILIFDFPVQPFCCAYKLNI